MLAARGFLTWRNQHCVCWRSRACPRRSESAWLAQLDLHAPRCGRRLRAELDEILKRANGVEERRNKVTHSQWGQPARKRKWPEPPCKAGPDRRSPNQTTPTRQLRSIQPVAHLGFLADQLRRQFVGTVGHEIATAGGRCHPLAESSLTEDAQASPTSDDLRSSSSRPP